VRFLSIPENRFVKVDGSGPAGGEAFEARMPGLYGVAYGLRFVLKRRGVAWRVGRLEGLWWHAGGATDLDEILAGDRTAWRWTLMIVVPDEATEAEIEEQIAARKVEGRARGRGLAPGWSRSKKATWPSYSTSAHTRRNVPRSSGCTPASPMRD
jgi:hypothetical protein